MALAHGPRFWRNRLLSLATICARSGGDLPDGVISLKGRCGSSSCGSAVLATAHVGDFHCWVLKARDASSLDIRCCRRIGVPARTHPNSQNDGTDSQPCALWLDDLFMIRSATNVLQLFWMIDVCPSQMGIALLPRLDSNHQHTGYRGCIAIPHLTRRNAL